MTKRTVPVSLAVAAAVTALALANTGPADAGALTTKAVRKIATKVVKKEAGRLTVADARALGGLPPSAYTTRSYVYTLTASGPETSNDWALTAPAGHYLASYAVTAATTGAATSFSCFFGTVAARSLGAAGAISGGSVWSLTGGGFIDLTQGQQFHCLVTGSAATVTIPGTGHVAAQLVLTRVDEATTTPLVAP